MKNATIFARTTEQMTKEEIHATKVWALYDVYRKLPDEQREELYKAVTENKDI